MGLFCFIFRASLSEPCHLALSMKLNLHRTLQHIAVRLHIVLRVGQVKRAMAVHTIRACLELEQKRLSDSRERIMVRRRYLYVRKCSLRGCAALFPGRNRDWNHRSQKYSGTNRDPASCTTH